MATGAAQVAGGGDKGSDAEEELFGTLRCLRMARLPLVAPRFTQSHGGDARKAL